MTLAATLVMIVCMTFRIPYAFQGAIYALMISRESPRATLRSAALIAMVTAIGAAYLLISVRFVISVPEVHFLWVIMLSVPGFLCDQRSDELHRSSSFRHHDVRRNSFVGSACACRNQCRRYTLAVLAVLVGVAITGAVELVFARLRPGNEVVSPITERLDAVETLFTCYAEDRAVDPPYGETNPSAGDARNILIAAHLTALELFGSILRRDQWCCGTGGQAGRPCSNSDASKVRIVSQ